MIKSIIISRNELTHHPGMWSGLIQYNPTVGGDDVDFLVTCENGDVLAIERKSPNDLLASIADNRLFNQAARMKELTPYAYVVVTGTIEPGAFGTIPGENKERRWNYASVWGALLSVQELGCSVVFCDGEGDFIPSMVRLAKRSRDNVRVKPVRQATVFGGQEGVLLALPGIGEQKIYGSDENPGLLKMFNGNLAICLMALTAPHDGKTYIPGWGKKSRDNLVDFLGGMVQYVADGDNNE